jgi:hypothetical protein
MINYDLNGIRLGPTAHLSFDRWVQAADSPTRAALARIRAMAEEGLSNVDDWPICLTHTGAAALLPTEARALGLPPAAQIVMRLDQRGIFPDISVGMRWQRPTGAPCHGVERTGAIVRVAGREAWLPDPLFAIADAVDALAAAAARGDEDERMRAVLRLKDVLPERKTSTVESPGALLSMRISYADAFTLDLEDGDNPRLIPQLRRNPADLDDPADSPALPDAQQDAFGTRFTQFAQSRGRYALGGGTYVVLSKPLQEALQVVKEVQAQPAAARRDFFRNPRPAIAARLGDAYDATVVENLFRETQGYSERVIGLGLWQPRVLPWVKVGKAQWFGPDDGSPSALGLRIGDREVSLEPDQVEAAIESVHAALLAGQESVEIRTAEGAVQVPPSAGTLAALESLRAACSPRPKGEKQNGDSEAEPVQALLILDGVDEDSLFARAPQPRKHRIEAESPLLLQTPLKSHQHEGVAWLRDAWNAGRPGVLLADDMGLGKTLQALAFMAMVRDAIAAGAIPEKPILIIAPTGLLANWEAEHAKHLLEPGLGRLLKAFGPDLRRLMNDAGALDPAALRQADWVLSTYETMRDHQAAFAAVPFAVIAFDEAQKIKNPGVQVTHVAKGMNSEFAIALTGTPVENRLADLWSITDTVHPGLLGDLKSFSARFEAAADSGALSELRAALEAPPRGLPAPMLRRLKSDHLKSLPEKREAKIEKPMPPPQADAYRAAVQSARGSSAPQAKLEALHRIRQVSLHPEPDAALPDDEFIRRSARLTACFDVLDEAAGRGERVLIFLDSLAMQANMAALIQRRYRMRTAPLLINGGVAGADRQRRVDAFQAGAGGFDTMILSPRAGGVGLTLTAATQVIHLSRWWNPAVEDQCTDRAYRIGQTRPVTVHLLLSVLPGREEESFDRKLDELLTRKRHLSRELLHPPAGTDADRDELFGSVVG